MDNLFHKFKTKKNMRGLLLLLYGASIFFWWITYSCSAEFEQLGYFIIHNRGLTSRYAGKAALHSIAFARYLASFFLTLSLYYTVSALLSIKHKAMYDATSGMEFVNCVVCSRIMLQESKDDKICQSCKLKANELKYSLKEDRASQYTDVKREKRTLQKTHAIFKSMFVKLIIVVLISTILTFITSKIF